MSKREEILIWLADGPDIDEIADRFMVLENKLTDLGGYLSAQTGQRIKISYLELWDRLRVVESKLKAMERALGFVLDDFNEGDSPCLSVRTVQAVQDIRDIVRG